MTKEEIKYGEAYEVLRSWDNDIVINFYKNGKLTNGGEYNSAITKISKSWWGDIEIQYYNPDNTYNTDRAYCVYKSIENDENIRVSSYFNAAGKRVNNSIGVFETHWETISEASIYGSYFDKEGGVLKNGDSIYHIKRYTDSYGRLVAYESYDENHKLMNDKDSLSVYNYKYDKHHMLISSKKFDKNRNHPLHIGSYNLKYTYDEKSLIKRVVNLDEYDVKINDNKGVCIYDYCYDIYGNTTQTKRYNKDEKPVLGNEDYFQWVTKYDSLSRVVFDAKYYMEHTLKFYDDKWGATKIEYPNDSLMIKYNLDAYNNLFNDDTGVAIVKKYKNSKKETVKDVYLNKNKNYAATDNGVVQYKYTYDEKGNQIEDITLDSLGDFKAFQKDVAIVRWEYDTNNNKIKTTYYNEEDELANANFNATFNFYEYNKENNLTERSYYDINSKPISYENAFLTKFYPNKQGNDTLVKKYGIDNKLIDNICCISRTYNEYGNVVFERYFDSENKRILNSSGVSGVKHEYDHFQNEIGYSYLGIDDTVINNKQGYASQIKELKHNGYFVSAAYYDAESNPAIGPKFYHKRIIEWGEMDEDFKESFFDVNNHLIENEKGIAIYEYPRAISGLIKVDRTYNKNKVLTENESGEAEIYYKLNLNGLYYLDKKLNAKGEIIQE